MEKGQGKTKDILEIFLQCMDGGSLLIRHLLVYLPKGQRSEHQNKKDRPAPTSFSPNENTGTKSALWQR
jgi:hypothetical protein